MDIDLVELNLNQSSINLLKVIIAFLMYAVALELKVKDFKILFLKPKELILGTSLHLFILPLMTYFFISFLDIRTSLALGLIMISACPIGNLANIMNILGKGNTALSVALTSLTNLLSLITTPLLIFYLGQQMDSTREYIQTVQLNHQEILEGVFLLLGLPIMLGMLTSRWKPSFAVKVQNKLKKIASAFVFIFIISALMANFRQFIDHARDIFSITLSYQFLTVILVFFFSFILKIPTTNRRALLITSILKNTGLALSLTLQFFPKLGGMALLVAFTTISQLLTAFILVQIFQWKKG